MKTKELTFEELMRLALKYYDQGGDGVAECWDEEMFDNYVELFGPITKARALRMFKDDKEMYDDMMGFYC